MIIKLPLIKNLAVFRDFYWDHEVKKENGEVGQFADINILSTGEIIQEKRHCHVC